MSLVVKIEVEVCSYRALFTSVPCNSTLDVSKNSPRVLILQVSLVVKIEVEACSYRALFTSVPCNGTLDVNKKLSSCTNTTSEPCS